MEKNKADILIIGAGICGLYAARELSKKGKKVILLEALEKTGGRIRITTGNFSRSLDAGPEFIHGEMPLTKKLFKEAGCASGKQKGKFYRSENGKIYAAEGLIEDQERILKVLKSLKEDVTLSTFLTEYFGRPEDKKLREDIIRLTNGFDAADENKLSVFAIRDEWEDDSVENSYEADGSYKIAADHLAYECTANGCLFQLNAEVKEVYHASGAVRVECSNGPAYESTALLVTVSLGILTCGERERGHMRFIPPVTDKISAAKKIGFGPVIKVTLEFRNAFWNDEDFKTTAAQLPDLRFVTGNSEFPVWWTKMPDEPFLVGWVGGSGAERLGAFDDKELFHRAIVSLSETILAPESFLIGQLVASSVSNWGADEFTKGAYSYQTPDSEDAKKILTEPVENTVYFAGEALGEHPGTVESALESAAATTKKILDHLNKKAEHL
jgi:monoamine oxidase